MADEITRISASKLSQAIKSRDVSCVEVMQAYLERIHRYNPLYNAIVSLVDDSELLRQAEAADKAILKCEYWGWMHGMPHAIKDLADAQGLVSTYGSPIFAQNVAMADSLPVARIRAQGAIFIGKTNTPEMGAGGNTFNEVFGMTRNPWNTQRNAGGSSGGSAAALATGEVWLSHGNDLAGSLRTPAAYCGVVGFRPSPGVARGGGLELGFSTESVQGPMARNVTDCALFLDSMSGFDSSSPVSYPAPEIPYQEAVKRADTNVRIAYSPDLNGFASVSKEWNQVLRDALQAVEKSGGTVEEDCPILPNLNRCYRILRAMVWATGPGRAPESVQKHFKQTLSDNIDYGRKLSIDDVYDAQIDRNTIFHNMRRFLSGYDVLACPTVSLEPGPVVEEFPSEIDGQPMDDYIEWLRFSFLSTTAGLPAISIPAGFTKSGLPVGLQLIGPPRGEAKVLEVARAIELAIGSMQTPIDPNITH